MSCHRPEALHGSLRARLIMQRHLKEPPPSVRERCPRRRRRSTPPFAAPPASARTTATPAPRLRRRSAPGGGEAPQMAVGAALAAKAAPAPRDVAARPPHPAAEPLAETIVVVPPPADEIEPGFTPRPACCSAHRRANSRSRLSHSRPRRRPLPRMIRGATQFVTPPARPAARPEPPPATPTPRGSRWRPRPRRK